MNYFFDTGFHGLIESHEGTETQKTQGLDTDTYAPRATCGGTSWIAEGKVIGKSGDREADIGVSGRQELTDVAMDEVGKTIDD